MLRKLKHIHDCGEDSMTLGLKEISCLRDSPKSSWCPQHRFKLFTTWQFTFFIIEISVKLIISYSTIFARMWEIKENGQYEDRGVKTGEVLFYLPQMLLWAIPQGRTVSTKNNDILWVKIAGDKDSNNIRGAWSWLPVEWNHVSVSEMTEKLSEWC